MEQPKEMSDYELELLIQEVEEGEILEAPKRLKNAVMLKSKTIGTQTAKEAVKVSVRAELILYSLKTAVAVAVAIFLFAFVNQAALQGAVPGQETAQRIETKWEESGAGRMQQWISDKTSSIQEQFENNRWND